MELDAKRVGQRLAEAMADAGVGSRILEKRIRNARGDIRGSSYGAIESYRKGTVRRPRVEVLRAAAEALDVRPEWLLGLDDFKTDAERRRAASVGEASKPIKEEAGGDFLLYRIGICFPEIEKLSDIARLLVVDAYARFAAALEVGGLLKGDDEINADLYNLFSMSLRQAIVAPLLMWRIQKGQPWDAAVDAIDWRSRAIDDYVRTAVTAFSMAVPESVEDWPIHLTIDPSVADMDQSLSEVVEVRLRRKEG